MNASSVFDMLLQYIDHHYLLGMIFLLSILYHIRKAFRHSRGLGAAVLAAVLFLFATVFNPLLYSRLSLIADGGASYYRFLWVIPLVPLGGCFLAEAAQGLPAISVKSPRIRKLFSRPVRICLAVLLSAVICLALLLTGSTYLNQDNLSVPENKFTISRAALDISQFAQDDPEHTDADVILAPTELMMELEAYDLSLVPALGRNEYLSYGTGESVYEPLLSVVLEGAQRNKDYITWNLYSLKVEYIAALTLFDLDSYMEEVGYAVYNRTGDYTLYKRAD